MPEEFEIAAEIEVDGPFFDEDAELLTEGPPGKSAYEVAVDQGFEGTVEEWLASLVGGVLDDDTLGVLDPDEAEAAIRQWCGLFNVSEDVTDQAVAFITSIITEQPTQVPVALANIAALMAVTIAQNSLNGEALGALSTSLTETVNTAVNTAIGDTVSTAIGNLGGALTVLNDAGPESGGKWAIVCSQGYYETPDVGPMPAEGFQDVFRIVPLARDPFKSGPTEITFLEFLTQLRQAPGAWGSDQDNHELALIILRGLVGFFCEHCRIDTPAPVQSGEDDPSRLYSVNPYHGEWIDPTFKLQLGQPLWGRFTQECDVVIEGEHYGRKTFEVATDYLSATEPGVGGPDVVGPTGDAHDRFWRKVAQLTYPGPDSVADAGMPWVIGLNEGLLGVQHHDRRPLGGDDSSIFLHFDTADEQADGTIESSVVPGMVWVPHANPNDPSKVPFIIDTTVLGLKAIKDTAEAALTPADIGIPGGLAELDGSGKVLSSQLPAYVDDVVEVANEAALAGVLALSGVIYVAVAENTSWRWSGSTFVQLGGGVPLGETSSTAYRGDRGKIAYDHAQITTGNPHGTSAADVGAVPTTRSITAGSGLTGGGALSLDRTLSLDATTLWRIGYGKEALSDLTRSSTSLLADDTLVVGALAYKYLLDGYITFTGDTTADVKIGITIPGGTMRVTIQHALNTVATTQDYDRFTVLVSSGQTAVHGTAGANVSSARISGWVHLSTPGDVSLVWATNGAGSATRELGSFLNLKLPPPTP